MFFMEFILFFVFVVAACYLLYLLFKKIPAPSNREKLPESKKAVVEVKPSLNLDKDLLLGCFVIPTMIVDKKTAKIQVILPNLTTDGELYYEYNWIPRTLVKFPKKEAKTGEDRVRLEAAEELIKPIIEHLQVKSELKELNEQYQELKELFNLVSTSEFYADQKSLYKRGLAQINELITKAENLEKTYYKLIREVLIGIRLAKYDPSKIPDRHIALDSQYQEIKEEYEHMKDTATAYNELVNNRQI